MIRGRRPSISRVGHVHEHGHEDLITGWQLGLCASGCACHRRPGTGELTVDEDLSGRRLGLTKYWACDCCQPWTADELAAVVRDLADIAALQHTAPGGS